MLREYELIVGLLLDLDLQIGQLGTVRLYPNLHGVEVLLGNQLLTDQPCPTVKPTKQEAGGRLSVLIPLSRKPLVYYAFQVDLQFFVCGNRHILFAARSLSLKPCNSHPIRAWSDSSRDLTFRGLLFSNELTITIENGNLAVE